MTQPAKSTCLMAYGDSKPLMAEAQVAAIADVTPAADGTTAGTAMNSILAALRLHGLIAD